MNKIIPKLLAVALSLWVTSPVVQAQAAIPPTEPIRGMIGVGTWATRAEFKDIKVISGDLTLLAEDFSSGMNGWQSIRGQWEVAGGALRQKTNEENTRAMIGDPAWSDYTLTLKARKLGGNEGFLIFFGMPAADQKSWWNIGGWGNTRHALEAPGITSESVNGKIETGRWYDIKLELRGNTIRAYLDNQLVHQATQTPAQRNFGHPLIPDLIADPSVAEFDGTFYLYGTTDGAGSGLATSGLPVAWKSKDFINWSFSGSIFPSDFDAKYWAPSAPILKDGRYYLFPTLDNRITAVVADTPEGPFRALDGKSINKTSGWRQFPISVGHPIDAEIFRDDDGTYYMAWSQRYVAKLNRDFSGFDGEPFLIPTKRNGYSEGPCILKRNGIYYYLYTLGGSENYQYAYMISRSSVQGPWEAPERDIISTTDHEKGIYGPGHGCFFQPQGSSQWSFIYLEYGRSGTNRQVWADTLRFNEDGTIQPIQLTLQGVGPQRTDPDSSSPNLAERKSSTASSTLPDFRVPPIADARLNRIEGYGPANALDGSNGSRWLARENDPHPWYQLDLGKTSRIKRTELYFVTPTAGHSYQVEYSRDGKTWKPYGGQPEPRVQSPQTDVKSVRARYLRVTILKGAPGIWEFRVY